LLPLTVLALGIVVAGSGCATAITSTPYTIAPDSAGVVGKVVSDTGGDVQYWAQYGPTTAYGSETPHQTVNVAKGALVTVRPAIDGLQRASTYHYRLCASDAQQKGGPGCGQDQQFTTQSAGCGETVTTDVKLTGDLDCPQEAGFVIRADGVDINLAGHSMFGGITSGGGGPRAIDDSGGYDDLTVSNGSLAGFGFSIFIDGGSRNQILDVTAGAAGNAVTIAGGTGNEIRRSRLFGRSFGIRVTASNGLVIADSRAEGSFGSAIEVSGDQARIVRDETPHSGGAMSVTSGIQLAGSGGRIVDNTVDGAWDVGGIAVYGTNNTVLDNDVRNAAFPCCPVDSESIGDGIFVGTGSSGTVLRRNRGDSNAGDGIQIRSAGVKLESNHAFSNGDLGIEAVAGVIDLGGNTAGLNGNPLQCVNVFCP
jgi:parallel beta helix pectate lyase-like protein